MFTKALLALSLGLLGFHPAPAPLVSTSTAGTWSIPEQVAGLLVINDHLIPKFDTTLGTLSKVRLEVAHYFRQVMGVENLNQFAPCTAIFNSENYAATTGDPGQTYWSVLFERTLSTKSGPIHWHLGVSTQLTQVWRAELAAFDGTADFGGTSGWSHTTVNATLTPTHEIVDSTHLAAMSSAPGATPSDLGTWTLHQSSGYTEAGSGSCGFTISNHANLGYYVVTVEYDYN